MVTGESNGCIRLWATKKYALVEEFTSILDNVAAISFFNGKNDTIVVVDNRGNFKEISSSNKHEDGGTSSLAAGMGVTRSLDLKEECSEICLGGISCLSFSDDGCMLAATCDESIHIFGFNGGLFHRKLNNKTRSRTVMCKVSPNGRSLLAVEFPESTRFRAINKSQRVEEIKITIWPKLSFEEAPFSLNLKGDRALWGRDGENLLIWNSFLDKPELEVYRTAGLEHGGSVSNNLLWKKQLTSGLHAWEAHMVNCKAPMGDKGKLMISEHYQSDTRKVTVWDMDKDEISNEMGFKIPINESVGNYDGTSGEGNNLTESMLPSTTAEGFTNRLNQDWHPNISVSRDERWITEFSWTRQSCTICSMESSVPVWKLCLPQEWNAYNALQPSSLAFDQEGHYLTLFTDTSIFAFAPLFLNTDSRPKETRKVSMPEGPWKVDYCKEYKDLLEDICAIPSAAMTQLLPPKLTKSKNWLNSVSDQHFGKIQRVSDCVYMGTDQSFVCIANSTEGNSGVFYFKRFNALYKRYHLRLPDDVSGIPRRLFSYNAGNKLDGLVILYEDLDLVAVFCKVQSHKSTSSDYELMVEETMPCEKCHSVSQSMDGTQLLFVIGTSVKILDLKSREIRQVKYRIEFDEAFKHAINSAYLKNPKAEEWWQNYSRRVSDDGKSVLLGWDITNQTSIVVSPDTEEAEYQRAIQDSDAKLSQFCSLSFEGRLTIYAHINTSKEGNISLALFDETSKLTTWRLDMRSLFPKGYKNNDVEKLLSEVTYGLSKDGSKVIMINHGAKKESKDAILTIGLVCGTGLFPCIVEKQNIGKDRNRPLEELMSKHGNHVLNSTTTSMTTLVQDVLSKANRPMIEYIKNFAKNSNVKIGLDWVNFEEEHTNYLEKSLKDKDKTKVDIAMEIIGSEVTPFVSSANAVGSSFDALLNEHQDTIYKALKKNYLVTTEAEFDVHVGFLDGDQRENRSVHIQTVDEYYDWSSEIVNENKMAENWKAMNKKAVEEFELSGNSSTTKAKLKFVRIANAAKVGMDGIIRKMLMTKTYDEMYKCSAMELTIDFKWEVIWKRRFKWMAAFYAIFLVLFTAYGTILATSKELHEESWDTKIILSLLLFTVWCCGLRMIHTEARQIWTFVRDTKKRYNSRWKGLMYFLKSRWNWVDLVSCTMILVVIPLFHCLEISNHGYDNGLSVAVAFELIIAYIKVWYFFQPFRGMGSFVLLINNIVNDCFYFLFLGFIIMLGFALALFVMFRLVQATTTEEDDDPLEDFRSVHRSVLALFVMLTGNLEMKMFTDIGGPVSVFATLIVVAYISAEVIMLLNLLIAIMGDTFDRVKCTENSQLLLARARFIDACEAELTDREIEKINKQTGKYVCAIFPEKEKEYHHKQQWFGKLSRIDQGIKHEIKTATCNLDKRIREVEDTMSSHFDKKLEENNSLLKTIENTISQLKSQLLYIAKNKSDIFLQENEQSEEHQALDLTSIMASESNSPRQDNAVSPEEQDEVLSTNTVQSQVLEPIQMAVNAIQNDDDILLEEALVEGINPDDKRTELHKDFNKEGLTLLQLCAICDSIRCAKVLMKCNANRDVNTNSECSLLHLCGTYNSFALAQVSSHCRFFCLWCNFICF